MDLAVVSFAFVGNLYVDGSKSRSVESVVQHFGNIAHAAYRATFPIIVDIREAVVTVGAVHHVGRCIFHGAVEPFILYAGICCVRVCIKTSMMFYSYDSFIAILITKKGSVFLPTHCVPKIICVKIKLLK